MLKSPVGWEGYECNLCLRLPLLQGMPGEHGAGSPFVAQCTACSTVAGTLQFNGGTFVKEHRTSPGWEWLGRLLIVQQRGKGIAVQDQL